MTEEASDPKRRLTLAVVFVTILIDFVGFSVLIPVLPLFADRLGATSFQIGWIVALYGLAQTSVYGQPADDDEEVAF